MFHKLDFQFYDLMSHYLHNLFLSYGSYLSSINQADYFCHDLLQLVFTEAFLLPSVHVFYGESNIFTFFIRNFYILCHARTYITSFH